MGSPIPILLGPFNGPLKNLKRSKGSRIVIIKHKNCRTGYHHNTSSNFAYMALVSKFKIANNKIIDVCNSVYISVVAPVYKAQLGYMVLI